MSRICVIGGANIDYFAHADQPIRSRDSNPGYLKKSNGGVARNIAENLARLHMNPDFITVIGNDQEGMQLIAEGEQVGIRFHHVEVSQTPSYIALMDANHDLYAGVAAMGAISALTVAEINQRKAIIDQADLVFLDTNLETEVIRSLLSRIDQPVYVDGISTRKAIRILPFFDRIEALKLNILEATALTNRSYKSEQDLLVIASFFLNRGLKELYLTLGDKGVCHATADTFEIREPKPVSIVNSTGAGDAFFAGVIYGKIKGLDPIACGEAAAILALQSERAVSPLLTPETLTTLIKEWER
jgi:pseudouridine kinase